MLLWEVIYSLLVLHDFLHRGQLILLHELLSLPLAQDEVLAIAEDRDSVFGLFRDLADHVLQTKLLHQGHIGHREALLKAAGTVCEG